MPHFTIEYSANLDARVDMGRGRRTRPQGRGRDRNISARRHPRPRHPLRALCHRRRHAAFRLPRHGAAARRGRDLAARKKAGEHIFKALSPHLDPVFAASKFALSFDMQINDKETSWKRNNIHEALKAEVAHG